MATLDGREPPTSGRITAEQIRAQDPSAIDLETIPQTYHHKAVDLY
jgi:hypothetical protein